MNFPLPQPPLFDRRPDGPMFEHSEFSAEALLPFKGSTTVTVALPAKDEAATVGPIVSEIRSELVERVPLIDELLVMDDLSTDDTAALATQAGATVLSTDAVLPGFGSGGKGEALWKSLHASTGDVIIWCDADIRNFDVRFIVGCLGPLLTDPKLGFIKGFYRRPLNEDGEGGGRVTELVARPLIATLFPQLDVMVQPLSGEFGGRRELLEQVPFSRGYAVDLALLIDLSQQFGSDRIGQVDLGSRVHRNRPLRQLGPQSAAIMAMALRRSGIDLADGSLTMRRPEFGDADIQVGDLPPLRSLGPVA